MPKASFELPNGTVVTIEGTTQEVEKLLQTYAGHTQKAKPEKKGSASKPKSNLNKTEESSSRLMEIVNLAKTCDEAEAIEKQILDKTSEVNRVLLPLYIIHEYLDNEFGLSTVEVDSVTTELGVRVSRQNALRVVKYSATRYVLSDKPRKKGSSSHYKLNRRGLQYMKSVIAGSANDDQN